MILARMPGLPGWLFALMAWSAAAQENPVAGHRLERINYTETGPHGVGLVRWHLWSNGQGQYVHYALDDLRRATSGSMLARTDSAG